MTSIFLLTFNCAKLPQNQPQLQHQLIGALPAKCPDLLVFGFQELVSIIDSTSHATVNAYLNSLRTSIQDTVINFYNTGSGAQTDIDVVAIEHIGAIGCFVLTPHRSHVNKVSLASAACGMLYSSMKGATGIRINYKGEEFTICVAHLSANEGNVERRNKDYWRLVTSMDFQDGYSVFKPKTHTFFMGDLNYRAFQYSGEGEGGESENLLENNDELSAVLQSGDAFVGMHEESISFKPTYKFHVGTKRYNMKRIPSWCDRVLFQSYHPGAYTLLKYQSLSGVDSSDHEPVYLHLQITGKPQEVVNSEGFLLSNGRDMRLSPNAYYESRLLLLADFIIGTALYGATTKKGRIISGSVLLVLLLAWYLL